MWYAKLFGIIWHSKQVQNRKGILEYVDDMDSTSFNLDSIQNDKELINTTSLDHIGYNTLPKRKMKINPSAQD